jgi:hypothetical protein
MLIMVISPCSQFRIFLGTPCLLTSELAIFIFMFQKESYICIIFIWNSA